MNKNLKWKYEPHANGRDVWYARMVTTGYMVCEVIRTKKTMTYHGSCDLDLHSRRDFKTLVQAQLWAEKSFESWLGMVGLAVEEKKQ